MIPKTRLLYLSDTYRTKHSARVLGILRDSDKITRLILDQTIFYPQGGGQPTDIGYIRSIGTGSVFNVIMVRNVGGMVHHEGILESGIFSEGEDVECCIDEPTRLLHARIHSGGHLLDHAVQLLQLPMVGSKGYHFPSGPYVEYVFTSQDVDTTPEGLTHIKAKLEEQCRVLVSENRAITITMTKLEGLPEGIKKGLPEKALTADEVRLVYFADTPEPVPCGGTHVRNTFEIQEFKIKKVSYKSGTFRVSYIVS